MPLARVRHFVVGYFVFFALIDSFENEKERIYFVHCPLLSSSLMHLFLLLSSSFRLPSLDLHSFLSSLPPLESAYSSPLLACMISLDQEAMVLT